MTAGKKGRRKKKIDFDSLRIAIPHLEKLSSFDIAYKTHLVDFVSFELLLPEVAGNPRRKLVRLSDSVGRKNLM